MNEMRCDSFHLEFHVNRSFSAMSEEGEDILQSTKSVIQGLDALKNDHGKMLESIVDCLQLNSSSIHLPSNDMNKLEEKAGLLRKSMDMIDLGKRRKHFFGLLHQAVYGKGSVKHK